MSFFLDKPTDHGNCPHCGGSGEFFTADNCDFRMCERDGVFWSTEFNADTPSWVYMGSSLIQFVYVESWHRAGERSISRIPLGLRIRNAISPSTWKARLTFSARRWRRLSSWTPSRRARTVAPEADLSF